MVEVTDTSYNITGLQPFTNYDVTVQANNTPVVELGPSLSEVFSTLPDGMLPPNATPVSINVPTPGTGSSGIVNIVIPAPTFRQEHLRYDVCQIPYRLTCLRAMYYCNTIPKLV